MQKKHGIAVNSLFPLPSRRMTLKLHSPLLGHAPPDCTLPLMAEKWKSNVTEIQSAAQLVNTKLNTQRGQWVSLCMCFQPPPQQCPGENHTFGKGLRGFLNCADSV